MVDIHLIGTWRRKWQPTTIFLPGESHGQRSLMGYSPWGCKESDMTERACVLLELTSGFIWVHHYTFHRDSPQKPSAFKAYYRKYKKYKIYKV